MPLLKAAAGVLAFLGTVASAATVVQKPVEGPFYLTVVPADGSASYPATIAEVSRGALILSSAPSYRQQWTFDR